MNRIMTNAEIAAMKTAADNASDTITACIPPGEFNFTFTDFGSTSSDDIEDSVRKMGFQSFGDPVTNARMAVAVLDTGTPMDDRDAMANGKNEWTSFNDDGADRNGHARHCGGIIGGIKPNTIRFGCLPGCRIGYFKVLNDQGMGTERQICQGFVAAVEKGYQVISMSLGGPSQMPTLERLIKAYAAAGGIVVAAAGNGGSSYQYLSYPAAYDDCVSVGSVNSQGQQSVFSQSSTTLDCVAYGERIVSFGFNGRLVEMTGTSMSTPAVAALAILFKSQIPESGRLAVFRSYLTNYCLKPDSFWKRSSHGRGIINAGALQDTEPKPLPIPDPKTVAVPVDLFPKELADRMRKAGFSEFLVPLDKVDPGQQKIGLPPELIDPLVKGILDTIETVLARRTVLLVAFKSFRPVLEQYLRSLLASGRITIVCH